MESLLWLIQFLCLFLSQLYFQASCFPSQSLNSSFASSKVVCPYEQSQALLQFKSSFSIGISPSYSALEDDDDYYDDLRYNPFGYYLEFATPYPKTDSWKLGTDCCLWDGVTCDLKSGNVTGLNLFNSMLYGTLHSNSSLFSLSHLQHLDLSYNNFNGSNIPSQFGLLLNLTHLNLNSSSFVGQVPSQISHLSNLVSLDLSWNYGLEIDTTTSFQKIFHNLTNLKELILNSVNMSMVAPTSFNLPSSLSSLSLVFCDFRGKFLEYVNLPGGLVSVDLSDNDDLRLDTTVFVKLAQNLTKLRELTMSDLNMSMVSPSSFMNLSSSLSYLNLGYCRLSIKLGEYVNLPSNLVSLNFMDNFDLRLDTTAFVKLVQNLSKLEQLNLGYTNLYSVAPASLTNLSSSLTYLRLTDCRLQGKFPNNIHLPKLIYLDLSSNNNLTIDAVAFTNLREVDLSYVNMSTVETTSLLNLSSSLSYLSLQNCGLRGEFPGNLLQPQLRLLSLKGNGDLTGFLPPPMSNWSSSLKLLDVSRTKITIHLENDFINNLRSVKELGLSGCNFIGSNMALLGNLSQLTHLSLSYNNFSGEIPPSFGNLQQLTFLDLSSNNFSGEIPSSFANLRQLSVLYLYNNSLSGPLPTYFSNFTQLQTLELQNNQFIGPIPSHIGRLSILLRLDLSYNFFNASIPSSVFSLPELYLLDLKNNQLQGHIGPFQSMSLRALILSSNRQLTGELSSSVCKLAESLEVLDLSNNSFTGFIPQCLGNFSNSLSVLHLGLNNFVGTIPTIFSEGNGLRYLNFNGNQLKGRIPPSLVNCINLEILNFGSNEINDAFPFFLRSLPSLQILVLRSNKIQGSLQCPIANCSFPKLRILDISNNTLSGPLPSEYFTELKAMMINFNPTANYMTEQNYSYDYSVTLTLKGLEIQLPKIQTALTTIDLSLNNFIGKIPDSIGKLKSLKQLNISHNFLTGNIQPSLGNLSNLESLDLSSNSLTGRIPEQLVVLTFLEVFSVAHNQLEGLIPNGNQFNTFGNDSYEGNLGLCGPPLSKACEDVDIHGEEKSNQRKEDDSDWKIGFGWAAIMTGYGCGLILGFSVAYIVFTTKKPIWFVDMVEGEWTQRVKIIRRYLLDRKGTRH